MRTGQVKTNTQINELKGESHAKVWRSQRWKKEITLKQEKKEVSNG
jgi:hypothetical protein